MRRHESRNEKDVQTYSWQFKERHMINYLSFPLLFFYNIFILLTRNTNKHSHRYTRKKKE